MKAAANIIVMLLLALQLTACGWQLRGSTRTPTMESITVRGGSADLRYGLEDELEHNGVQVHNQAPYLLIIHNEDWQRRTAAVDSRGRQAEIELRYQLRWHLEDRKTGAFLTTPEHMMSIRSFAWFPGNATASSDEEQLVRDDLYDDMIYRLMNQLANVTEDWETH